MSELIRKAQELRGELDAKAGIAADRQAQAAEQERLRAIQHEKDVRQSSERVSEFLRLTSGRCQPTALLEVRNWDDNSVRHYRGWVMRQERGGYDEPEVDGLILLPDGTTYKWDHKSQTEGQKLNGEVKHWRSRIPTEVIDDAYCGDAGLIMLGTKLAELGIV